MTQFTKKAAMIVLTVAVIAGCHKNDSAPSKTDLLTSGSWRLTASHVDPAIDANGDGVVENDIFAVALPCVKDNLMTFKREGTYTIDEGATKCDPSAPQIMESSNWKFMDNESKIVIGDPGYEETGQLLELSSTVLQIKIFIDDGGSGLNVTQTYGH
ncbi:hypothetical protein QEG73_13370 [Chitinophagaceae bacterium 26-R-25]|nr:hypothetical protein [Chitinophagaceae bacterium 26-R-25]